MTAKTLKWIAPCLAALAGIALWLTAAPHDETAAQLMSIAMALGLMVWLICAMPSLVVCSTASNEF